MMPPTEVNSNINVGHAAGGKAATPAPPPLGTLIDDGTNAGALQLTTVLGYGGYGVVYRASAPSGSLFAVKCLLRTSNPNNPKQQQRQRRLHMREIAIHRLAGAGAHPGVVRLHRVIEPNLPAEDGSLTVPSPYTFLVMDYAPCGDLFTLILHKQVYLGRTGLVANVFAQLASAVSHCHSLGIFHRDLKPENVLCWDGGATVKLSDFGLATTERRSKEWRTGSVYHMSPECQNGNSSSPPYSPLANDVWSLAILLLNLLTARNPWARASPSDPTFSAYLTSPRHFLPQVLPISNGLNDILLRALDVQMERRELLGVDGLADGVARLVDGFDESHSRRNSYGKHRKQGFYAPDVVFEGGMARCPWEVGMHIPSGSSGSDHADTHHIRVPSELLPKKEPPVKKEKMRINTSSTSFGPSARTSPTRVVVEEDSIPPPTPAKDVPPLRWSKQPQNASKPVTRTATPSGTSGFEMAPTSQSVEKMMHGDEEESVSEMRFARASNEERGSAPSSSESSASSSELSSLGSVYSATRNSSLSVVADERYISEAGKMVEADAYAYAYAAEQEALSKEKHARYAEYSPRPAHDPSRNSPLRRQTRFRARSRGRQPYPQSRSDTRNGARSKQRRQRPQLKLDVELPSILPLHDSSGLEGVSTMAKSRTRGHSSSTSGNDLRARLSSSPFAYSVSRSGSSGQDPDMDLDAKRLSPNVDVSMISPTSARAIARSPIKRRFFGSRQSSSEHGSGEGMSLSRSSATRSSDVVDDGNVPIVIEASGRSPSQPSFRSSVGVDSNGRSVVRIDRSIRNTDTSLTGPEFDGSHSNVRSFSPSPLEGESVRLHDPYNRHRSPSPSFSSSLIHSVNGSQDRYSASDGSEDVNENALSDSMETDMFELGQKELRVSRHSSKVGPRDVAWVDELRRAVEDALDERRARESRVPMEADEYDQLPSLPGSFPTSPIEQARATVPLPRHSDSGDEVLHTLHTFAVEPNPWVANDNWGVPTSRQLSITPQPSQTFMAITTDVDPQYNHAVASEDVQDLQEYANFLRYADSPVVNPADFDEPIAQTSLSDHATSSSGHSFRSRHSEVSNSKSESFRAPQSSVVQEQRSSDSKSLSDRSSQRRPRSRARSLLKFVSRRPFSSTGAGFLPRRSRSPSFPVDANTQVAKPGFTFGADSPARFSFSFAAEEGDSGDIKVQDEWSGVQVTSITETIAKLASSSPAVSHISALFAVEKEVTIPPFLPQQPVSLNTTSPAKTTKLKPRSWSFNHHSRGQIRRRSRSVSPPPTRGSPRDVLFRLRSARNWFWSALSGMSSGGVHARDARSKRPHALRTALVSIAA